MAVTETEIEVAVAVCECPGCEARSQAHHLRCSYITSERGISYLGSNYLCELERNAVSMHILIACRHEVLKPGMWPARHVE